MNFVVNGITLFTQYLMHKLFVDYSLTGMVITPLRFDITKKDNPRHQSGIMVCILTGKRYTRLLPEITFCFWYRILQIHHVHPTV